MALMRKEDIDDTSDLEVQFILRLPHESARILRALMHAGVSLKDRLSIDMYKDLRHVVFQFDNWIYYGKIYNLPTVIESLKTIDGKSFFKTADISQICVCTNEEFGSSEDELNINKSIANNNSENSRMKTNKKYNWPHGLTPPLKNVRKHRFRKTLPKEYVELSEIEREVRTLLRADNDAVSVRWEIIYENDKNIYQNVMTAEKLKKDVEEMDIFGDISDDIEAEDCSNSMQSSTVKAQIYDSSDDEKNFEEVEIKEMEDDTEERINSVLHENITNGTSEMETHSISRRQELDEESESTDINYQEFCTSLKYDIFDLEAERDQLINKLEGIENFALKERLIETLNNFEKEIVNKKSLLQNFESYVNK